MRLGLIKVPMLVTALLFGVLLAAYTASPRTALAQSHGLHGLQGKNGVGIFTHVATPRNSLGDWTDLDNVATNNHPNALVFVTPNWNPGGSGGTYDNHPLGVWYHSGKWAIFNQDITAIPNQAAFNVYALPDNTYTGAFIHVATTANSAGDWTDLNNPATNNNPNALLLVTPNWNPGGSGGTYDNHPIGVWYHSGKWAIFNQDGAAIPNQAAFNVYALTSAVGGYGVFLHTATSANSAGDWTDLTNIVTDNHSDALVFTTPNWNPGGSGGTYDDHNIGVWYHSGKWAIFNQDGAAIPNQAAFNVLAVRVRSVN